MTKASSKRIRRLACSTSSLVCGRWQPEALQPGVQAVLEPDLGRERVGQVVELVEDEPAHCPTVQFWMRGTRG